jgi:hypothetical protein
MKNFFVVLIILFLAGFHTTIKAQGTAEIKFEKMDHLFGKISEDAGPAVHVFNFANIGKVPLVISSANASCGCTTPEWTKEPVLPGKSGFIKVSYDPKNRPGSFTKTVTVYANVPNSTRVLTISGEVSPHVKTIEEIYPSDLGLLRMKNNYMAFVKVKDNEIKTDTLFYYNSGTVPVTIGYKFLPAYLKIKAVPETVQPKGKGYFLISWDGRQKTDYGFQMSRVYLLFNGKDDTKYALTVSATIEEDFSKLSSSEMANAPKIEFNSKSFQFGEITEGQKVDYVFKIMNKGKSDLLIRSAKASCGCTAANTGSNIIKPGQSTDLKVSFDSQGKVGMQNKTVTVISNDPSQATVTLAVTGTVKKKEEASNQPIQKQSN